MSDVQSNAGTWTTSEAVGCAGGIAGIIGGIAGVIGTIVGGLSWYESHESRKIAADAQQLSQRSYDRIAGKITPVISVRGETNALVLQSMADLKGARIGVSVKNVGGEPIDMIRTNVVTSAVWLLRTGQGQDGLSLLVPQTDEAESFDHKLLATLQPDGERWIDLKKQIVGRLLKLRVDSPKKFGVFVIFNVDYFGRLVGQEMPSANPVPGASQADAGHIVHGTVQSIPIHWYPDAFPKAETDAYLNAYHPAS